MKTKIIKKSDIPLTSFLVVRDKFESISDKMYSIVEVIGDSGHSTFEKAKEKAFSLVVSFAQGHKEKFEKESKYFHNKWIIFKYKHGFLDERTVSVVDHILKQYNSSINILDANYVYEPKTVYLNEEIIIPHNHYEQEFVYVVDTAFIGKPTIEKYKLDSSILDQTSLKEVDYQYIYKYSCGEKSVAVSSNDEVENGVFNINRWVNKQLFVDKNKAEEVFSKYIDDVIEKYTVIKNTSLSKINE